MKVDKSLFEGLAAEYEREEEWAQEARDKYDERQYHAATAAAIMFLAYAVRNKLT